MLPLPASVQAQRAVAVRIARSRKVLETVPWTVIVVLRGAAYASPHAPWAALWLKPMARAGLLDFTVVPLKRGRPGQGADGAPSDRYPSYDPHCGRVRPV